MLRADKVGLVLAGGAAKGAYQIGCWRALSDAGVKRFDVISGTSAGALNAALIAMGDYELASNLWKEFSSEQIFFNPGGEPRLNLFKAAVALLAATRLPFELSWRSSVESAALWLGQRWHIGSNRPLSRLIRKYVSLSKLRLSGTKVFCTESLLEQYYDPYEPNVTLSPISYSSMFGTKTIGPAPGLPQRGYLDIKLLSFPVLRRHWMPHVTELTSLSNDDEVRTSLLRSANLPLFFRSRSVGQKRSTDGGIADKVPIYPVAREGCDLIVVIYLDSGFVPPTQELLKNAIAKEYLRREILVGLKESEANDMYKQFCKTGFPAPPAPPFSVSKPVFVIPSDSLGRATDFTGGPRALKLIELGAKDTKAALFTHFAARGN